MTTLTKEEWTSSKDGKNITFFRGELAQAEILASGESSSWRGGWRDNGNGCCVVEFDHEPTVQEVEALY